uniref:Uncharacterized protein n=1 Tax=Streptomyces toxytricini TaxID=67369 RepID=B9VRF8_STRT5|nr:hypothetical protein [Streptomyces toxytricini]
MGDGGADEHDAGEPPGGAVADGGRGQQDGAQQEEGGRAGPHRVGRHDHDIRVHAGDGHRLALRRPPQHEVDERQHQRLGREHDGAQARREPAQHHVHGPHPFLRKRATGPFDAWRLLTGKRADKGCARRDCGTPRGGRPRKESVGRS